MKLIFLDIDGVLNHQQWFSSEQFNSWTPKNLHEHDLNQLCPYSVAIFNDLVKNTEAKVVLSSSWRKTHSPKEMQGLLKEAGGFEGEIIDSTPVLRFSNKDYNYSVPRGCEVKAWMEMNKGLLGKKISKADYAILDDDSDFLYCQRERYFRVDPYCGITPNLAKRVEQLLN